VVRERFTLLIEFTFPDIPVPRMRAAPAWRHADRRISAGLTVDATAGPRNSRSLLTTAQSHQRPSSAAGESNENLR
jgi:hypothetical protein